MAATAKELLSPLRRRAAPSPRLSKDSWQWCRGGRTRVGTPVWVPRVGARPPGENPTVSHWDSLDSGNVASVPSAAGRGW